MIRVLLIIFVGFVFSTDWINFNGTIVSKNILVLKINDEFAPKLGNESQLEWDDLEVFAPSIPKVEYFKPLFRTVNSQKHYQFNLHRYYKLKLKDEIVSKDIILKFLDISIVDKVELSSKNQLFITPNDPYYSSQWNHDNYGQVTNGTLDADIDTDHAWDISVGSEDVVIAILDSGVDLDHPDYEDRIINGYDFANNDSNANDDNGHGTSCAGIAAAKGNNGIGIAGICWNCKIMPVKVMGSDGTGQDTDIAEGVTWASDNGANVISMSLGGGMYNSFFEDAIDYATSNGTIVIAATGNDNFGTISYPSRYDNCVAVGAMSPCNERKNINSCDGENFWGSNYGTGIDFLAPGVKIPATSIGGGYTSQFNGTSSACPHAAGVAGLILSVMPSASPEEVRTIMQIQTDDIGSIGFDLETGFGRLNANKCISNLLDTPDLVVSDYDIDFVLEPGSYADYYFVIGNAGEVDLEYQINQDGYSWNDSNDEHLINNWINIENMGNIVVFQHNDQGIINIPIGFDFPFYDGNYSTVVINPNGWIGFGEDSDAWDNTGLPNNQAPQNAILGFWDDLNPINNNCNSTCSGNVYYYSTPEIFVVWYDNVAHWVTDEYPNSTVNFQYVLYPDGKIELNYNNINGPSSPTIGIQNEDASEAALIALYQEAEEELYISDNFSTWLYQFPSWLTANISSGVLGGGDAIEVIFTANSNNLIVGTYSSLFWMSTNDYNNQLININVNLEVTGNINPCADWIPGDINNDGTINILDILIIVNIILSVDINLDSCAVWAADYNLDELVNVTDIISMVNSILNQ
ncbi:MAG: hypothetical protein CMG58_00495 [Candidatus Marinimicrobia bacterium]|nr:hypothetical protein [Candidatus Neomarinimicrobiota bacterium]|tara:strand:- start:300 stop:2714 length:2415 start_codon:yes stop_codon:yes gene_type:complete